MKPELDAQLNSLYVRQGLEQCVDELEGKTPFYEARTSVGQIVLDNGKIAQVVISVNTDQEDFIQDLIIERFESK